jgi:hypothetical protein
MAQRESTTNRDGRKSATGLEHLLAKSTRPADPMSAAAPSAALGELVALTDGGRTPLIAFESDAQVPALIGRTTIDLHADHIGSTVVLLFEAGDPQRPIIVGILRDGRTSVAPELSGTVEISADGERMTVAAHRELVLQCGKASLTLQQDGTIRIVGERILSRATGPNRVQGGSIELN